MPPVVLLYHSSLFIFLFVINETMANRTSCPIVVTFTAVECTVRETSKAPDCNLLPVVPSIAFVLNMFHAFARSSNSLDDILFISSFHHVQFILPNAITALLMSCVPRKTVLHIFTQ